VRVICLLTLAAVLHITAFAQRQPDPEAGNKRAVSVAPSGHTNSVQAPRPQSAAASIPRSGLSSARDLAKIERTSVQQIKITHKTKAGSKPGAQAVPGTQPQTRSKPMKFSYHAPKAAAKATSAKNPAPVR
jgi:hypothetical protein